MPKAQKTNQNTTRLLVAKASSDPRVTVNDVVLRMSERAAKDLLREIVKIIETTEAAIKRSGDSGLTTPGFAYHDIRQAILDAARAEG